MSNEKMRLIDRVGPLVFDFPYGAANLQELGIVASGRRRAGLSYWSGSA